MHDTASTALHLHWFWAAIFAGVGVFFLLKPACLVSVGPLLRKTRFESDVTKQRVEAAFSRREQIESMPPVFGRAVGIISIVFAFVAGTTRIQTGLLYALLCLALAGITAVTYVYLRRPRRKRAAILTPRSSSSVIPPYWFVLSVLDGLAVLAYATRPELTAASIVVAVSTLVTAVVAWRLTQLPALLEGNDIEAERLVDDRVRAWRSASTLQLAFVQPFVFCTQSRITTLPLIAIEDASMVLWFAFFGWFLLKLIYKPMNLASA